MADRKLTNILEEMAHYVQETHEVIVDRSFGTVDIRNLETGESDYFLQGHDAEDYIMIADDNWKDAGYIDRYDADCSVAKTYVDCL